ncbi:uncharacterized protein LOC107180379 [Panthera tigris]|uniref:uncharacterized protein LOC107180379 n=1 Tax=Panthera tigris TaxID=9694 RepID=UPI001C6F8CE7|nr:uncharacterized protein LOC107180379 [Panthera tigris]
MSSAKSRRIAQPRPAQSSLVQLLILGIVGQVGGSSVIQRLSSGAGSPCWVPPGREPVVTPLPFPRKKLWKANLIFRHSQGSDPLLPVAPVLPSKLCLVSRAWCGPRGLSPLDPTTRLSSALSGDYRSVGTQHAQVISNTHVLLPCPIHGDFSGVRSPDAPRTHRKGKRLTLLTAALPAGTILAPPLFLSLPLEMPELLSPSMTAKADPKEPRSLSMSDLPVATHASNPRETSEDRGEEARQPDSC